MDGQHYNNHKQTVFLLPDLGSPKYAMTKVYSSNQTNNKHTNTRTKTTQNQKEYKPKQKQRFLSMTIETQTEEKD